MLSDDTKYTIIINCYRRLWQARNDPAEYATVVTGVIKTLDLTTSWGPKLNHQRTRLLEVAVNREATN